MSINAQAAIARARREVEEEDMKDAVKRLKTKYRELSRAQTVVANIDREIKDLEIAIEQGNAID